MGGISLIAILGGPICYNKINQRFDNAVKILSYDLQYARSLGEEGKISKADQAEYNKSLNSLKLDYSYLESAVVGVFRLDLSKSKELWEFFTIKDIMSSQYVRRIEREKDNLMKKVSSDRKY